MLFKSVTVMLLASSLAAAELEKKQYGYDDSYYSSLEAELNSLATNTDYGDYADYLTEYSDLGDYTDYLTEYSDLGGYSDIPTDYTASMPDVTDTPGSSASFNDATITDMPSVTYDMPPSDIESVLETAIPASYLSEMADPSAASSLISSIQHGDMPSWYQDLPTSVKSWLSEHYATATGMPSNGHQGGPNSAPPSGMMAFGLMGAAGIFAVAVLL